jgi:hypothetical protein
MLIETDKIVGWLSPYRHIQRGPGGSNLEGGGGGGSKQAQRTSKLKQNQGEQTSPKKLQNPIIC